MGYVRWHRFIFNVLFIVLLIGVVSIAEHWRCVTCSLIMEFRTTFAEIRGERIGYSNIQNTDDHHHYHHDVHHDPHHDSHRHYEMTNYQHA